MRLFQPSDMRLFIGMHSSFLNGVASLVMSFKIANEWLPDQIFDYVDYKHPNL